MKFQIRRTDIYSIVVEANSIEEVQALLDDPIECGKIHNKLDKGYDSCETSVEQL